MASKRNKFYILLVTLAIVAVGLDLIRLHSAPATSHDAATLRTLDPNFQELATFRPLGLKAPVAADKDGSCAPRNIYIDAGANLANSMDMFKATTTSPYPDTPWEVFSFELIPLNAHYTMLQADFLNGHRSHPAPPPPTYEGNDEKSYSFDVSTAWGQRNVKRWKDWEESFTSERSTQGSFERLLDLDATAEYGRMLEDARCKRSQALKRQPNGKAIYYVYPLGVSLTPGNFTVEWGSQNYINGGSNLNYFDSLTRNAPMRTFRVNTVPLVHWIISSFRPADYVFLKLDVEGAEYDILRGLFALGAADLIDEVAVEFHSRFNPTPHSAEKERVLKWILEASEIIVHPHF